MEEIKVRYIADIPLLEHIGGAEKSNWIDLYCADDIVFTAFGEFKLIPLGVAMKLPAGYEAIVAPRSSTFKRYGIIMANSIGIIDESYCGADDQWQFPAVCLKPYSKIPKDTRIAQFRIIRHQPEIQFEHHAELSDDNRGGIGSTGR